MRAKITVLILLTVIASGCTYSNAGDSEELAELASRADKTTYNVKYNFSMKGTALLGQVSDDAELFASNGKTRFDRTTIYAQGNTTTSLYSMNGSQALKCTESNYVDNRTSKTECNITEATPDRYIDGTGYSKDEYSVNYVKEKRYAGRKCKLYKIAIPPSDFENSSVINTGAIVDLCLDKEKGYVAYNSMNLAKPVNSGGSPVSNIYTLEAKNYSSEVTEEDVRPPEYNTTKGNSKET
ncbi:MAG: hypothetical protein BRC30_00520 [Nanohaloarchaea archaeon SW_7_46_7]|nr:MAG: hypothetical protein BRC30_00520 [Nanohaloarchaea archaeon SW_7_46_7]